jgi:2-oxoglutarate ferredoxin oxidoreductase subunit beta
LSLAIALDCSFVARGFCGDMPHLKELIKAAVSHKGFALVDILQNCITFNKLNTIEWYRQRVYHIEDGYDPRDRVEAFRRTLEWGERIPIGIFYTNDRPAYEGLIPIIRDEPLVKQTFDSNKIANLLKEFY